MLVSENLKLIFVTKIIQDLKVIFYLCDTEIWTLVTKSELCLN